jgi:hypothetical protein
MKNRWAEVQTVWTHKFRKLNKHFDERFIQPRVRKEVELSEECQRQALLRQLDPEFRYDNLMSFIADFHAQQEALTDLTGENLQDGPANPAWLKLTLCRREAWRDDLERYLGVLKWAVSVIDEGVQRNRDLPDTVKASALLRILYSLSSSMKKVLPPPAT